MKALKYIGPLAKLAAWLQSAKAAKKLPVITPHDLENLQYRLQTCWPLHYERSGIYYKMIDSKRLIQASLKGGFTGAIDRSRNRQSFLFKLWLNGNIEAHGFKPITEMMFHTVYTEATDQNNTTHRRNTQLSIHKQ